MKLSAILAPLIAAKAPHDQIMAVVEAFEAQQADALERRRKTDADRQARKRDKDKSRDVTLRHSDRFLTRGGATRVEDKTLTTDIEPQENNDTPRAALMAVLDADRAVAVVEHRQRLKKPLTAYAAKLLANKLAKCPDPNLAADTMIAKGWQSIEPEWLDRPQARGSPARPTHESVTDVTARLLAEMRSADELRSQETDRSAQPALVAIPGGRGW